MVKFLKLLVLVDGELVKFFYPRCYYLILTAESWAPLQVTACMLWLTLAEMGILSTVSDEVRNN